MDSQIRRLIASHGGYAYEIAGRVVAFFDDSRGSIAFSALLTHRSNITVERCGSQLSFPLSARLAGNSGQILEYPPASPVEPDPSPRRRTMWSLFRRGPARRPPSQELPTEGMAYGQLNEPHFTGAQFSGSPKRP